LFKNKSTGFGSYH